MNVEIGAEAALFPEKEYINGIFVAVLPHTHLFDPSITVDISVKGDVTIILLPLSYVALSPYDSL